MKFLIILAIAAFTINGQILPLTPLSGIVANITGALSNAYTSIVVNKTQRTE